MEHDLSRLLEESVQDLTPPVAVMVATGTWLGRRRLRRRLQAAGAALAVGALATTGVLLGLNRSSGDSVSASAPPVSNAPATSVNADPLVPFTEAGALKVLVDHLPPGAALDNYDDHRSVHDTPKTSVDLSVDYDDGHGASTIQLSVQHAAAASDVTSCAFWRSDPDNPGPDSCTESLLADGSRELTAVTHPDGAGFSSSFVELVRPSGEEIRIDAFNGTVSAFAKVNPRVTTRAAPAISLATAQQIVQSPLLGFQIPQSVAEAGERLAAAVPRAQQPAQ
ncbi:hypothetical protein P3T36_006638 [Kitasatospora sp. MAP12-15]|uniref:hypothetical protein n=1 Tax=unclassified Kitasatospora TaxID=2633591 RepID=UPI0035129E4D